MNMTVAKLEKLNACSQGIDYFKANNFKTVEQAVKSILKTDNSNRFNWSNWLLSRTLNKQNNIRYAIFAAEQVINIFKMKYPDDMRPRNAINAVKAYLKNPSKKNKDAAYAAAGAASAAASAAGAASYAASAASASAASASAYVAAYAAAGAASAAASAAGAASYAAAADAAYAASASAYAAKNIMYTTIINYGLKLITKQ